MSAFTTISDATVKLRTRGYQWVANGVLVVVRRSNLGKSAFKEEKKHKS